MREEEQATPGDHVGGNLVVAQAPPREGAIVHLHSTYKQLYNYAVLITLSAVKHYRGNRSQ